MLFRSEEDLPEPRKEVFCVQVSEGTDLMTQVLEDKERAHSRKRAQTVPPTNRGIKRQWHDLTEDLPRKKIHLDNESKELHELLDLVETRLSSPRCEMLSLARCLMTRRMANKLRWQLARVNQDE